MVPVLSTQSTSCLLYTSNTDLLFTARAGVDPVILPLAQQIFLLLKPGQKPCPGRQELLILLLPFLMIFRKKPVITNNQQCQYDDIPVAFSKDQRKQHTGQRHIAQEL